MKFKMKIFILLILFSFLSFVKENQPPQFTIIRDYPEHFLKSGIKPAEFREAIAVTSGTPFFILFSATDPDGDGIRYIIDWGDGDIETTKILASGDTVSAIHTYHFHNAYSLKITTCDKKGAIIEEVIDVSAHLAPPFPIPQKTCLAEKKMIKAYIFVKLKMVVLLSVVIPNLLVTAKVMSI